MPVVLVAAAVLLASKQVGALSTGDVLTSKQGGALSTEPYLKTSLEILFTQAFNRAVQNSDWNRIFGSSTGVRASSMCTGSADTWLTPESPAKPGSDLARVLERGAFRCGYIRNLDEGTMKSGETVDSVTGAIPDFWSLLATYAGEAMNVTTPLTVEWMLYDSAQDVLDAVVSGSVDAACGQWAPDAVWDDGSGTALARGYAFSVMYCPVYFRSQFVFLKADDTSTQGVESFEDFIQYLDSTAASGAKICVWAAPGSGLERTCNDIFQSALSSATVECTGTASETFTGLVNGDCIAASSPVQPPDEDLGLFVSFLQPSVLVASTLFRKDDVQDTQVPNETEGTSMQLVVTKAFDSLVSEGVYAEAFGDLDGTEGTSYCTGSNSWPEQSVETGSDLEALLEREVFRCGYTKDLRYATQDGKVILNTLDPSDVSGAIPDYWDLLIKKVGSYYEKNLTVEWYLVSDETTSVWVRQSAAFITTS